MYEANGLVGEIDSIAVCIITFFELHYAIASKVWQSESKNPDMIESSTMAFRLSTTTEFASRHEQTNQVYIQLPIYSFQSQYQNVYFSINMIKLPILVSLSGIDFDCIIFCSHQSALLCSADSFLLRQEQKNRNDMPTPIYIKNMCAFNS